jgi:hypothetical protein
MSCRLPFKSLASLMGCRLDNSKSSITSRSSTTFLVGLIDTYDRIFTCIANYFHLPSGIRGNALIYGQKMSKKRWQDIALKI